MAETRIDELQTFLSVAAQGSFAAAASELGRSTSGVSKQVGALEQRLGVRLLNRTTRRVALTEVGRVFQERGGEILAQLEELESSVRGLHTLPRGTLRVTAPQDFGRLFLCGIVGRFAAEFPELRVEVELTDRIVDVVEEGLDIAVRIARLPDSGLVVRKLGVCQRVLCATPKYLEQYGRPETAAELERHNCIEYEHLGARSWTFIENGDTRNIVPTGRLRANAGWAMKEMALAGLGIALLPTFLVADELETGSLVSVLGDSLDADIDLMAVIPHRSQVAAKVRVFIEHLVASVDSERWFRRAT